MPRPPECRSITTRVLQREMQRAGTRKFRSDVRFKGFCVKSTFDTHDHEVYNSKPLAFMRKRSKIVEMVTAGDVLFALTQSGICAAFDRGRQSRLCFLNVTDDEVIRSLFFNKAECALVTVSVFRSDNYSSLHCRATPLACILAQRPTAGRRLFEAETLRYPGFVEFDEINQKVLTYDAEKRVYKIWDLKYRFLFAIKDVNIQEIKISQGVLLVVSNRAPAFVTLTLRSIEDGRILQTIKHLLHKTKRVDVLELFGDRLLVKQESKYMQIVNIRDLSNLAVDHNEFHAPQAFIYLNQSQQFLTIRNETVQSWDLKGELGTRFEDHVLWNTTGTTNGIFIPPSQDIIISFCRNSKTMDGALHVSHLVSGRLLEPIPCPVANPGEEVTSLHYSEEHHEMYTGTRAGLIHIWQNGPQTSDVR
eukprot:gnl/Hemi2/20617_TR6841_c0_g1_i1.p1 gnl/Hemi2/20617_TR6841_c0_g1~~gnl/Hemi2/20617_TR6841_c0_g1_i1.p1  ORF type:complete len:419 (+),score=83.56 gnl/Hemi2/20617_TR6841_c0_g1_i1:163-1419(+)